MIVLGIQFMIIGMGVMVYCCVIGVDVHWLVSVVGCIFYLTGCVVTDINKDLEDKKTSKKIKQLEDKINMMIAEEKKNG